MGLLLHLEEGPQTTWCQSVELHFNIALLAKVSVDTFSESETNAVSWSV